MALLSVEELLRRPGFEGVDQAQAETVLEDVSALVIQIASCVDPPWTDETVPPAVIPVIVAMARRALLNPMGKIGETLGDYTWQTAGQSVGIMTAAERRIIRQAAGCLGAASVSLSADVPLPAWRGTAVGRDDLAL